MLHFLAMSDSDFHPGPSSNRSVELNHRHAIVAGFGIVGRMVAQQLERAGVDVTLIELNRATSQKQHSGIQQVVCGDVCEAQTLQDAGIDRADALILTIPDEEQAVRACATARKLNPQIFIAARTNFFSKGLIASQAGADAVVVEEVVTAEAMQRAVVRRLLTGKDGG